MQQMDRRSLAKLGILSLSAIPFLGCSANQPEPSMKASAASPQLPPPIGDSERLARIERAQSLMRNQNIAGLVIEAGTSMLYFSGLAWRQASRLTALIIPAEGDPVIIAPAFEAGKLHEVMIMEMEV
ncbi:MAG: aminopeptidase P family N-terminal domain-containing protein, partial [Pseudomonadota bacterium]